MAIAMSKAPGATDMIGNSGAADNVETPAFPRGGPKLDLRGAGGPRFLVTVDTEEEFDWGAPFARDAHGLSHLASIPRFQAMCEGRGVKPLYLVDYPIAADPMGAELFGDLARRDKAEIGLQLHPWVTPPFDEVVSSHNSYACNLPEPLERAKLRALHDIVRERLAAKPVAYRAGRYGIGADTAEMLIELDIAFDTSVRSLFDYSAQGGPDFTSAALRPYWAIDQKLVELPLTSVFGGLLRPIGTAMFERYFETPSMRALLARSGLLERIALTPEGIPASKAVQAIDVALKMKLPLLVFSFHSPSLAPGHTPYVRNNTDLEQFYSWWETVFVHLEKCGVTPVTVTQLRELAFA